MITATGNEIDEPVNRSDRAATYHVFASTAYLGIGTVLGLLALASLRFPAVFPGSLGYGRLRAMAMIGAMLGWLLLSLLGGFYYALPRLTGTPLRGERLAQLSLIYSALVYAAGIVLVGLGFGDGREPFGLPWWWDAAVFLSFLPPMAVVVNTIRHRLERVIYPTLWFGLAVVVWLPILYLIGNLPGLTSAGQSLGSSMLSAGLEHLVIIGGGTGLAYFTVVMVSGNPLASRQLARVGFWSLCFGAVWWGPAQIASGPFPGWLAGISAVLGLALPLATLTNATNLTLTVGPGLSQAFDRPAISSALLGCLMATFAGVVTALASFRSASALVSLTLFSEGLTVLIVFGAGGLLTASWTEHALPNLIGREPQQAWRGKRRLRLTLIGMGGSGLCLMGAGLLGGYAWSGGAYTDAFENTGSGWAQVSGLPSLLTGLAVLFFLIGALGLLSGGLNVVRTFTSGRPIAQNVLITEETTL